MQCKVEIKGAVIETDKFSRLWHSQNGVLPARTRRHCPIKLHVSPVAIEQELRRVIDQCQLIPALDSKYTRQAKYEA